MARFPGGCRTVFVLRTATGPTDTRRCASPGMVLNDRAGGRDTDADDRGRSAANDSGAELWDDLWPSAWGIPHPCAASWHWASSWDRAQAGRIRRATPTPAARRGRRQTMLHRLQQGSSIVPCGGARRQRSPPCQDAEQRRRTHHGGLRSADRRDYDHSLRIGPQERRLPATGRPLGSRGGEDDVQSALLLGQRMRRTSWSI